MQVLIDFGAEVEAKNSFGNTPLHYCGLFGSVSVAKVRFERLLDVSIRIRSRFSLFRKTITGSAVSARGSSFASPFALVFSVYAAHPLFEREIRLKVRTAL